MVDWFRQATTTDTRATIGFGEALASDAMKEQNNFGYTKVVCAFQLDLSTCLIGGSVTKDRSNPEDDGIRDFSHVFRNGCDCVHLWDIPSKVTLLK